MSSVFWDDSLIINCSGNAMVRKNYSKEYSLERIVNLFSQENLIFVKESV